RFRRSGGNGRNYLALWVIESPQAFKTHEYTSDWGFFEWRPYIIDWSRDMFSGHEIEDTSFAVSPEGALLVVSFDHMSAEDAAKAQKAYAFIHPNMSWLKIAGLDQHTPLIGLEVLPELPRSWCPSAASASGQEAIYTPISDFHRASEFVGAAPQASRL